MTPAPLVVGGQVVRNTQRTFDVGNHVTNNGNIMGPENNVQGQRELTYGEKAVGLTFNPGNDPKVDAIKKAFAVAIDEIHSINVSSEPAGSNERLALIDRAIRDAQSAQMFAVKAVTWKF